MRGPSGAVCDRSPRGYGLQPGSVQIFYRLTSANFDLSTGNGGQSRAAAGQEVPGGRQGGECQESDSEAANNHLRV